MVALI